MLIWLPLHQRVEDQSQICNGDTYSAYLQVRGKDGREVIIRPETHIAKLQDQEIEIAFLNTLDVTDDIGMTIRCT
jgi:hypothetical protein